MDGYPHGTEVGVHGGTGGGEFTGGYPATRKAYCQISILNIKPQWVLLQQITGTPCSKVCICFNHRKKKSEMNCPRKPGPVHSQNNRPLIPEKSDFISHQDILETVKPLSFQTAALLPNRIALY